MCSLYASFFFLFVVAVRPRIIDIDYPVRASCEQSQFWGDRIATYKPAAMRIQGLLLVLDPALRSGNIHSGYYRHASLLPGYEWLDLKSNSI